MNENDSRRRPMDRSPWSIANHSEKNPAFFPNPGAPGVLILYAVAVGSYRSFLGHLDSGLFWDSRWPIETVVWNIRLPRIMAAIYPAGGWFGESTFQSLLKNPLASPQPWESARERLFGASLAIVVFGAEGMQAGSIFQYPSRPCSERGFL